MDRGVGADGDDAPSEDELLGPFGRWSRDALAVMDREGIVRAFNAAAAEFFGSDVRQVVGRPLRELFAGIAGADALTRLADLRCGGVEIRMPDGSGTIRHIMTTASAWRHRGRDYLGLRFEDLTERRRSEEELTQLASFPELDPNPIYEQGLDGEIHYMNHVAEATLTGALLDKMQAGLGELLAGRDLSRGVRLVREVELDQQWFEQRLHYIPDWQTLRVYAAEITERKLAEKAAAEARDLLEQRVEQRTRELARANEQLEREIDERRRAEQIAIDANRIKGVFLANMSHELRTPLNAIIGYTEILLEEDASPDARDDVQRILVSARHLLGLINNILDISKIESGKTELFREVFHVADLVADVAGTARGLMPPNDNTLLVTCDPDVGVIDSDLTKLRQVLLNLLSNAAKFTRRGAITLAARRDEDWVEFAVSDTGIGIPAAALGRLFKPFVQADSSTTRRFGGTGLGLAICAEYCRLLGGSIHVDSTPGRGSTFTVRLPSTR